MASASQRKIQVPRNQDSSQKNMKETILKFTVISVADNTVRVLYKYAGPTYESFLVLNGAEYTLQIIKMRMHFMPLDISTLSLR